ELMALGYLRDGGPLRAGQLAERLGLSTAAITALVDRLERIDYAHRLRTPSDRRAVLVQLTPTGRAEGGNLFQLLASNVGAALHRMSPPERPPPKVEAALDGNTPPEREAIARFLANVTSSFERRGQEAAQA